MTQLNFEALRSSMASESDDHATPLWDMVSSLHSMHDDRFFEHAASLKNLAMLLSRTIAEPDGAVKALAAQHTGWLEVPVGKST